MQNELPKIVPRSQQGKQPLLPAPESRKSARLLWHPARYGRRAAQPSSQLTAAQDEGCGDSSRVRHATRADFLWRRRPRLANLAGAVEQSSTPHAAQAPGRLLEITPPQHETRFYLRHCSAVLHGLISSGSSAGRLRYRRTHPSANLVTKQDSWRHWHRRQFRVIALQLFIKASSLSVQEGITDTVTLLPRL